MFEGFGQTETLMPILVKRPSDYLKSDGSFDEEAVRAAGEAVGVVRGWKLWFFSDLREAEGGRTDAAATLGTKHQDGRRATVAHYPAGRLGGI